MAFGLGWVGNLIGKPPTVAAVLGDLDKIPAKLDRVVDHHTDKAAEHAIKSIEHGNLEKVAKAEAVRAASVSAKVKDLLR